MDFLVGKKSLPLCSARNERLSPNRSTHRGRFGHHADPNGSTKKSSKNKTYSELIMDKLDL